mgnify:FL=1
MDRLTDEELKEVRIYPVREKVDIILMPQKKQLEEIRRHLKDVLDSDVDEKVHNILSVVDYQKRTTNFSSAKQVEYCIGNILMNWQYDTIGSVRKNLKSNGYDYDRLCSVLGDGYSSEDKSLSEQLRFIREHLKDYLDSDVYELAEEVSLYPEDSVEKLKDNPEELKAEFNDICFEWEYDTIESVRKDLKSKGYDLDGLLSLEITKEQERMAENRKTENETYRAVPKDKILCFDVETTGLSREEDEILQLSIVDGAGKTVFNEYIKPTRHESWDGAEAIHGISPSDVADKPTIEEYRDTLNDIFKDVQLLVGYNNIYFDNAFLKEAGIQIPEDAKMYDVMLKFAPIYGEWNEMRQDYKWQKLAKCAEYYGFHGDGQFHDSLEDVRATLYCFNSMISEGQVKEKEVTAEKDVPLPPRRRGMSR